MTNLKVFNSSEFGELGVLSIEGREYFPATACAKLLGYAEPQKAMQAQKNAGNRDALCFIPDQHPQY